MGIFLPLLMVFVCCLVIWKTGDSFETASRYLGRNLSDGVRGATINAIASSMPELLTTLIFLIDLKDAVGFSGGIGATAGSAIYNSLIIPAFVGLIVFFKLSVKRFRLTRKIIIRDGFFLLLIETLLIFILSGSFITWKDGLALVLIYFVYLFVMLHMMKRSKATKLKTVTREIREATAPDTPVKKLATFSLSRVVLRGKSITSKRAWLLLSVSTAIMGASCLLLVQACEYLGSEVYYLPLVGELKGLNIPIMFLALVLAAAASSVPDTIISMKDAQRGNYDDAFSNVLGSNIFDICFALGFPIFIYTLVYGPFTMPPEIADITRELRIVLVLMTAIALIIFIIGKNFTRSKAVFLVMVYGIFITYVILRGFDPDLLSGRLW